MHSDYRIVFSDIDGTFLDSRHRVLPGTAAAVRRLAERGIPLVLVSARMPAAIVPILAEVGVRSPLISYSGALVLAADGRPLHSQPLTVPEAGQVLQAMRQRWPQAVVNFYADDVWYVRDTQTPEVRREEEITSVQAQPADFEALLAGGCRPHKLLCMGGSAVIAVMEAELHRDFPALTIVRSSPILLEIMAAGISKLAGIEALLAELALPLASALAFGDNYNDLEMLSGVGCGVAMGNAPKAVQAAADAVTAANDAGGIEHWLAAHGLV